jgi:amidase
LRTTWGSPLFADFVPAADSLHVQRIRAAGAIIIGKTNTPEWGLGSQTYNAVHGVTRNAWDATRTSGGSSGGAAVALAQRMLPVADGSDMGGSLRNPAGWNNVFGLRPSRGRVPSWPAEDAFFAQLATDGPMARNVPDLAALLATMAGPDPRTPLALDADPALADPLRAVSALACDEAHWRGVRIGWLGDFDGHLPTEPGLLPLLERSLGTLRDLGCHIEPLAPDFDMERLWQAFCQLRQLQAGTRLKPYWQDPGRRALLKPEAQWEVEQSLALSAADVQLASNVRTAWYQRVLALFEQVDYLALPTAQCFAFDAATHWPRQVGDRPMDSYHRWMEVVTGPTMAGLPAISVPAGFDPNGVPVGLQLVGRPNADLSVMRLAQAWDTATGWSRRRPPAIA